MKNAENRQTVWEEMVGAFAGAGVPLHVFSNTNVRNWIQNHVKCGQTLPSETTLRKCLVKSGNSDLEATVSKCRYFDDSNKRPIFNIYITSEVDN